MKKAIVSVFLLFFFINSNATHLVGGTMSYKYFHTVYGAKVRYLLTVKLYRDCEIASNATFDDQIFIGVYNNNKLCNIDTFSLNTNRSIVSPDTCSCCPVIKYCYEEGIYQGYIDLDSNKEYAFIASRCCLALSENAEYDQGFSVYSYMQNSSNASSSPFLNRPLINYIWPKKIQQYSTFHAIDLDGDSLKYEIVEPLLGGNQSAPLPALKNAIDSMFPPFDYTGPFTFHSGYTYKSPFGSYAKLTLNSYTGEAIFDSIKNSSARFYWCIKVSEYRNNILIGITYAPISSDFNPSCTAINTGIKEAIIHDELIVSPNPFQNQITISNLSPQVNKIEVYDMSGKLQEGLRISAQNQTTISFPSSQSGLYLLRFIDKEGNTIGTEKVAKSN